MKKENSKIRTFGGKTEGFTDKEERAQEQKHYKAFLRGETRYSHGLSHGNPIWHDVKVIWKDPAKKVSEPVSGQ